MVLSGFGVVLSEFWAGLRNFGAVIFLLAAAFRAALCAMAPSFLAV